MSTVSPLSLGSLAKPRSRGRTPSSRFSAALLVVTLAVFWAAFAPVQAGGQASYVIVNGNSMQPVYDKGDLVITREKGEYGKGDIAAYRHPDIGPIIHRVVGRDGDRFVFRGDNNSWLDSYRPRESEFIGEAWIHIPSAGKPLGLLRGPGAMGVLAGLMGVIAMTTFTTTKDGRKNFKASRGRNTSEKRAGPSLPSGDGGDGMIGVLAAVLLASLLLGLLAFTRPATLPYSDSAGYRHKGEFAYSAYAKADVYDESGARTGEPVFLKLSESVEVSFDYRLASDLPAEDIKGTYEILAEISDVNGWKRTVVLQPETPFEGERFEAMGILDLSDVRGIVTNLERQTGLHTDRYAVSIAPVVSVNGELAGQRIDDDFSPRLDFWMDPLQLQLQTPVDGSAPTDPVETEAANPLKPSEEGSLQQPERQPNTVSILMFDLGVWKARVLSLLGLALSAAGLVWLGVPLLRAHGSPDEPTRIKARYGGRIVAVDGDPSGDSPVIEVATFEDLAKISETSPAGESILHRVDGGSHDYYAYGAAAVYRYRVEG